MRNTQWNIDIWQMLAGRDNVARVLEANYNGVGCFLLYNESMAPRFAKTLLCLMVVLCPVVCDMGLCGDCCRVAREVTEEHSCCCEQSEPIKAPTPRRPERSGDCFCGGAVVADYFDMTACNSGLVVDLCLTWNQPQPDTLDSRLGIISLTRYGPATSERTHCSLRGVWLL